MRHYYIVGGLLILMLLSASYPRANIAEAGDNEDIQVLILSFFESLRSGDTNGVLDSLTEPILSERTELLQKNPNYPKLLMRVYEDAEIELGGIKSIRADTIMIDVKIKSRSESVRETIFLCKKKSGLWKIAEEINRF